MRSVPSCQWRLRDVARSAFWLIPTACVLASIGLGIGVVALDEVALGVNSDGTCSPILTSPSAASAQRAAGS